MDPTASGQPQVNVEPQVITSSPTASFRQWIKWIIGGIILFILFSILSLNYFNILPLSKLYPQLNWLPHQISQKTSPDRQNLGQTNATQQSTPTPIATTEQMIKTDSENVISAYINPAYTSSEKEISEIIPPKPTPNQRAFTITWKASDGITIKVTTEYLDGKLYNYQQITLGLPEGLIKELNTSNAVSIAEKYLSFKIQSTPKCAVVNIDTKQSTLCDIALANKEGTVGVQITYHLQ